MWSHIYNNICKHTYVIGYLADPKSQNIVRNKLIDLVTNYINSSNNNMSK